MPLLLAPENLVEKEINGAKVTCRDLLEYFKVRFDYFAAITAAKTNQIRCELCQDLRGSIQVFL